MGWRDQLLNKKPGTVGRALSKGPHGHGSMPQLSTYNRGGRILSQQDLGRGGMNKGGRVGLERGGKGIIQKIGEKISRKWRGKEKTEHKGLEQDLKTGAYTHKAPKDRMDTKPGRWWRGKIATGPHLLPGTKITPPHTSNDMSYKARKKQIAKEKKEADRKKAFDKKHGVK